MQLVMDRHHAGTESVRMIGAVARGVRAHALCLLLPLLAAASPGQNRIPLPQGTGSINCPAGWLCMLGSDLVDGKSPLEAPPPWLTVLQHERASLAKEAAAADHRLCFTIATSGLRLLHAYSAEGPATAAGLQAESAVAAMQQALATHLDGPDAKATFVAAEPASLFAVGGIALRFTRVIAGQPLQFVHYAVPAGDRVQYFETLWSENDTEAPAAFAAILRSFDGAREPAEDKTLQHMLLGGVIGGVLGAVTARRRQQRRRLEATRQG